MNYRSRIFGCVLAGLTLLVTSPLATDCMGQTDRDASWTSKNHSVSIGRIIRSGQAKNGTPRFALLSEEGSVTAYVVPSAGTDLSPYLNEQVGVTARAMRRGPNRIPYILAQQVSILDDKPTFSTRNDVSIQSTGFDEPRIIREEEIEADQLADVIQDFRDDNSELSLVDQLWRDLDGDVIPAQAQETLVTPPPMAPSPGYTNDFGIQDGGYYPDFSGHRGMGLRRGQGCFDPNCKTCGASRPAVWYARFDLLGWKTKGFNVPPLITTSEPGTVAGSAGVLGVDTTSIVLGNQDIFEADREGGRLTIGRWHDQHRKNGAELEYFALGDDDSMVSITSGGDPIIARPFTNALLAREDAELVAFPGIVAGTVSAGATGKLQSFAARYRRNLRCRSGLPFGICAETNCVGGCECVPSGRRLDTTIGYRYMNLKESLWINERLTTLNTSTPSTFDLTDSFGTKNEFHGAEFGLVWEAYRGRWTLELLSRVSVGNNRRSVAIDGQTISRTQGVEFTDPGGLLALDSNMGRYSQDKFVAIPEIGANVGFHLSPNCRILLGYSALYWDKIARPGEQIDLRVNTDLLPPALDNIGPELPTFSLKESSFWAQGVNLGLDFQW